jgi:hypothetical protein
MTVSDRHCQCGAETTRFFVDDVNFYDRCPDCAMMAGCACCGVSEVVSVKRAVSELKRGLVKELLKLETADDISDLIDALAYGGN